MKCPHCQILSDALDGRCDRLVYDSKAAIVVAGDHQYFPGYCVVIAKAHVREMHSLPEIEALELFQELMKVGRKIENTFQPLKMNYASLGNIVEHLHWHVFPRYQNESDPKDHPWKNADQFFRYPTFPTMVDKIRAALI